MLSKKFCPNCGSEDITLVAGGITGNWMCKNCGFSGSVFPEKEILGRESMNVKDKKIKNKEGRK